MAIVDVINVALNTMGRQLRGYMLFHFDLIDTFLLDVPYSLHMEVVRLAHRVIIMKVAYHFHKLSFDPDEPPFDVERIYEKVSPPILTGKGLVMFCPEYWKGYIQSAYNACDEWLRFAGDREH